MRSISSVESCPKSKPPLGLIGSLTQMPSMMTLVWSELAPRMKTVATCPGPPAWATERLGTWRSTSMTLVCCFRAISSAVMTVMELATSRFGVSRRVAVTTICSASSPFSGAAADGAATVSFGAAGAAASSATTGAAKVRSNPRSSIVWRSIKDPDSCAGPVQTIAAARPLKPAPHGAQVSWCRPRGHQLFRRKPKEKPSAPAEEAEGHAQRIVPAIPYPRGMPCKWNRGRSSGLRFVLLGRPSRLAGP